MRYAEQKLVIRLIPGLESVEFARLGKIHKNTYIDSPRLLAPTLQLRADQSVLFAGQITGVEGYTESSVSGIVAGINAVRLAGGLDPVVPPPETMTGSLLRHITAPVENFQPMNANFGILPALSDSEEPGKDASGRRLRGKEKKAARRAIQSERAMAAMKRWCDDYLES
jgi:methylenetetrahydrofolate--tRNA-(uracil-5-)-methyltransferase